MDKEITINDKIYVLKKNTGYWNTGYCNTGHRNTGDCNTGHRNTGNRNTGDSNTGDCNTGHRNTGDCNTGNCNTGYCNTGDCNTGDWNTGYWNTGYCNTATSDECLIFNKKGSRKEWQNADKPEWLYIILTKWIFTNDMKDKEKEAYPSYTTTGGYLKIYSSLKEAYIESWNNTTIEDRKLTLQLPNFDDKIFKEIFGFSAIENID